LKKAIEVELGKSSQIRIIKYPSILIISHQGIRLSFGETLNLSKYSYEGQQRIYKVCSIIQRVDFSKSSGHFTSFVLNQQSGQWYCFNDLEYSSTLLEQVLSIKPYVLIYQLT
jgi:hypothetical protein